MSTDTIDTTAARDYLDLVQHAREQFGLDLAAATDLADRALRPGAIDPDRLERAAAALASAAGRSYEFDPEITTRYRGLATVAIAAYLAD